MFPCAMVSSLELQSLFCQTRMFLALISLFPNLDDLMIAVYRWYESGPPELRGKLVDQNTSPTFRGRFKFTSDRGRLDYVHTEALHVLASMPIRLHTVSFYVNENNLDSVSSFLGGCAQSIQGPSWMWPAASLHSTSTTCGPTSNFQSKHHQMVGSSLHA